MAQGVGRYSGDKRKAGLEAEQLDSQVDLWHTLHIMVNENVHALCCLYAPCRPFVCIVTMAVYDSHGLVGGSACNCDFESTDMAAAKLPW